MGLLEIALASLCLNVTLCPEESDNVRVLSLKKQRLSELTNNLKEDHLRITSFANGELSGYISTNGVLTGTGVAFDVIDIIQQKYGFNYSVIEPTEHVFLSHSNNDGAKNLLETNKADVAAAFLPIINSFRNNISYSTSFDTAEWMVLMKRPKDSATGSGLLAPFTTPVWILIILSLLVVGPIIYLLILLQARLCKDDENRVYPLPECIWFVYGALLKQGSTISPTTDSSRLLFSTWWIFITVLTAFYTANLTAFLTLSKFTLPIKEPSDIRHNRYQWVSNKANGIRDFLVVESKEGIRIKGDPLLVDQIGPGSDFPEQDDISILQEYVTKKERMFIREASVINHVMYKDYKEKSKTVDEESDRCTYVVANFPITSFPRAFAYKKDFKYQEIFDSAIQHLVESGIIQYKLRENLPDTKICPLDLKSTERRLRNSDLLLTYLIVAGGLGVAAVTFIVELVIRYQKRNKKKRKMPKNNTNNEKLFVYNNNSSIFNNNLDAVKNHSPPPPSYHTLFYPNLVTNNPNYQKKTINGRDYWVGSNKMGLQQMIPLRTPSALLFQYSN